MTVSEERTWPIAIATGWGFGVAYADAQVTRKKKTFSEKKVD